MLTFTFRLAEPVFPAASVTVPVIVWAPLGKFRLLQARVTWTPLVVCLATTVLSTARTKVFEVPDAPSAAGLGVWVPSATVLVFQSKAAPPPLVSPVNTRVVSTNRVNVSVPGAAPLVRRSPCNGLP
ncbi:MAG: hypothetical protein AUH29_06385 [Candidatus Rokubacteria bacterium 13_1_40CM_69_27]|nr:MAG: hypothetical protein AUH29_06385 [Candidatus Rokubacteria bacterium 13_1_40CM_69_27]